MSEPNGRRYNDTHHIFFPKKDYHDHYLKELREFPYCKIALPKTTTHRAIHIAVREVPAPKQVNAYSALEQLKWLTEHGAIKADDPPEKRLDILAALFDCAENETTAALRAQAEMIRLENVPLPL